MTPEQMITLGLLLLILAFAIWALSLSKAGRAAASPKNEGSADKGSRGKNDQGPTDGSEEQKN